MRAARLLHEMSLKEQAKAETKAVTGKSTQSAIWSCLCYTLLLQPIDGWQRRVSCSRMRHCFTCARHTVVQEA